MNDSENKGIEQFAWMQDVLGEELPPAPYPGLRPFEADESIIFFGREQHINDVLDRIAHANFVAVVGPSGCGKSSLVKAGVIPALNRGRFFEAGTTWRVADMRPGTAPMWNLAKSLITGLSGEAEPDWEKISDATALLTSDEHPFKALREEFDIPEDENILVLVDQFEELFRYEAQSSDEEEANDFVSILLAIHKGLEKNVSAVITMRTDHLGDCPRFDGLPEAINSTLFLTPRLSIDDKRGAIEGPVRLFGDHIAPDLTDRLVHDMESEDDQLPLMQHVLSRMWRQSTEDGATRGVTLETDHYARLGGIDNALNQHARSVTDEIADEFGDEGLALTEGLFRQLTERRDDSAGQDVRRPNQFETLARTLGLTEDEETAKLGAIIEKFARPDVGFVRIVSGSGTISDTSVIDIVHECLIRKWDRCQEWVRDEWESAKNLRDLAGTFAVRGRSERLLDADSTLYFAKWRETQSPNAAWASRYNIDETQFDRIIGFLDDSIAETETRKQREREELERDAKREEQAKRQKAEAETARAEAERARAEVEKAEAQAAGARQRSRYIQIGGIAIVSIIAGFLYIFQQTQQQFHSQSLKLQELQNDLSELILLHRSQNAENMMGFLEKTILDTDAFDTTIIKSKVGLSAVGNLLARKDSFIAESDKTKQRVQKVAKTFRDELSGLAVDMLQTHETQREQLLASFDEHVLQIHTNLQKDMAAIPRPIGRRLDGQYFIPAVTEDGRLIALTETKLAEDSTPDSENLHILVHAFTDSGFPPPGQKPLANLSLDAVPGAWVIDMGFSPRGKYLSATVQAPGNDLRSTFMWVLIWDVKTGKVVDKILVAEEFTDLLKTAFSRDGKTYAILDQQGNFIVCKIGYCGQTDDPDNYRKTRIETTQKSARGQETLTLVDLIPRDNNTFLAVYSAKELFLSVYANSLEGAEPPASLNEPTEKLPRMPYLDTERLDAHYCNGSDTLIVIDKANRMHAWRLTGEGPPECTIRFTRGTNKRVSTIWEIPKDPIRWSNALLDQLMMQADNRGQRIMKKWKGKAFEARLARTDDVVAEFRFPFTLEHHLLDGRGLKLITLIVEGVANQRYNSIVAIWDIFSGHHLNHLASQNVFRDIDKPLSANGAVGYDAANGRFLLLTPDGVTQDAHVGIFRDKDWKPASDDPGIYRFDPQKESFVSSADGKAPIPARMFANTLKVSAREETPSGGQTRTKVSLTDPKSGKTVSFYPNLLWKHGADDWDHHEGQVPFGLLSADGRFAAISVPGSAVTERSRFDTDPALEIWDTETGALKARVIHKSRVVGAAFLDGGRYLASLTAQHGAWLSVWRLDDLETEVCGRLEIYDLVKVAIPGGSDDGDACTEN